MASTWDMVTEGEFAGTVIQPPVYTTNEDDSTRVRLWLQLATPLGAYPLATNEGLDHRRMLDSDASDVEREAMVRFVLEADPNVATVDDVTVTTDLAAETPSVAVSAAYTTFTNGEPLSIGLNIGA